jgi:hypothetical protein
MLTAIRRSRTRLLATAAALALSVSALAATATPAHAYITAQDMCGSYIYGWNYWNGELYNEFVRTGGEDSAYLDYSAHWVNVYYDLVVQNHC